MRKIGSLFNRGRFVLHSGQESNFKIDCDHLSSADLRALAFIINEKIGPFSHVVGVPRGGEKLAKFLVQHATGKEADPGLLVDDVFTTGKSMEEWREKTNAKIGAVIFARGNTPDWIYPVFRMET